LNAVRPRRDAGSAHQGKLAPAQQGHQGAPRLHFIEATVFETQLQVLYAHIVAVVTGEDGNLVKQGAFCIGQSMGRRTHAMTVVMELVGEEERPGEAEGNDRSDAGRSEH
jgi:hypothetical protein